MQRRRVTAAIGVYGSLYARRPEPVRRRRARQRQAVAAATTRRDAEISTRPRAPTTPGSLRPTTSSRPRSRSPSATRTSAPADPTVDTMQALNANLSFLVRANIKLMLEYHRDLRDSQNYHDRDRPPGGFLKGVHDMKRIPRPRPRPRSWRGAAARGRRPPRQGRRARACATAPTPSCTWRPSPGKTFPAPKEHAKIDQMNLVFIPHVLPVLVGTTVDFLNSDAVLHNVFSPDACAEKFNLGTWPQGPDQELHVQEGVRPPRSSARCTPRWRRSSWPSRRPTSP